MELLELNKENFEKAISENANIIVDVYTEGCGPCKHLEKELKILMETQNPNFLICKLDVNEYMEKAIEYDIMAVPVLLFFEKGKFIHRERGFKSAFEIKKIIDLKFQKLQ